MINLIENNAYRILGLDNSANQKYILKRYKEITNRLKIDDFPKYDLDINLTDKTRNEESVNDALKRLQSAKNNIKEFFFWFQITDTNDEKATSYLKNNKIDKAIETWEKVSGNKNSTAFFYKKNLAITYCLLLFEKENNTYFNESISIWHEICNMNSP